MPVIPASSVHPEESPAVDACCVPSAERIDAAAADELAQTFKALGDPTRVRLLAMIAASESGEACICDLVAPVGLSQPTVSHHMRILTEARLVTREQRGRWAYYGLAPSARDRLLASVAAVTGD
jgi:ArsR family transcriptional regulator, arsenate/arsenite/antimonite-responsive transcriptional repressor